MKINYSFIILLFTTPVLLFAQGVIKDDGITKSNQQQSDESKLGNIPGRKTISLNGKWHVVIDPYDFGIGSWSAIWKDQTPKGKTDFYEYSFDEGHTFNVPGDFNSQLPELAFFEATVWYKKTFTYRKKSNTRLFIYFGGVNYVADVFLNNEKIGSHEGGFTPFQFELTDKVKAGDNSIIVRVNNQRIKDGIPSLGMDWFNYGGITRDVSLVEIPESYIEDYFIQLKKNSDKIISGWIQMKGMKPSQEVNITIPEAKIKYQVKTNDAGFSPINFPAKLTAWTPENPKLYNVIISSKTDTVAEQIGFRTIDVKGQDILLNGKPIFLKGVSFHEEVPQEKRRAYSESDTRMLLTWAKELGCNFVRLAHYPQNEHTVRMAEKMGLMMWEEVPVYQGINFGDPAMQIKMNTMLTEMISRDKNRCGIILWSMSNETSPGRARNLSIINMVNVARGLDATRLITSAFNKINYSGDTVLIQDTLSRHLDVVAVNEYLGWYNKWPCQPKDVIWKSDFKKPLIMSEFGAEALYGNHGAADVASSWSEEYQEQFYKDQITMLKNIPFLQGVCPWLLVDFRSPRRLHPVFQDGQNGSGMWNRKGLLSDKGDKKKAWYIMNQFYKER